MAQPRMGEGDGAPKKVLELLEKGPRTAESIAVELDLHLRYVSSVLVKLLDAELVHRPAWELPKVAKQGCRLRAIYHHGPGRSADRPLRWPGRASKKPRDSKTMEWFGQGIGKISSVFDLARITSGERNK